MAEEAQASMASAFQAYRCPLEAVISFKYLVRVLTTSENECMAVVKNLIFYRKAWKCVSRILGWEGADTRTSGTI